MAERTRVARTRATPFWRELKAVASLSWPIALTNLAQIAMGTTDVIMMGWRDTATMAAGALATNVYFVALVFGIGLLNAVSAIIARDLGRDRSDLANVAATVRAGLWSALLLAVPSWAVLWWTEPLLLTMGQDQALAAAAGSYARVLQWALLPFWAFLVLRAFLAALERPVWSFVISGAGVLVNAAGNWCFLLGRCGFESFGIAGSGIATVMASTLMLAALVAVVTRDAGFARYRVLDGLLRIEVDRLEGLWKLGLPMAATLLFEVTIFNVAVFLMGLIGTAELAAHAIAIQLASLTFMVPLGIGHAATVRVALGFGARDQAAMRRSGQAALAIGLAFTALTSLIMLVAPQALISAFIDVTTPANADVVRLAASFLFMAALFQLADGTQAVASGMLRGLHDTRMPMLIAAAGYWGIGLPLGMSLAFGLGMGGIGIWIGLAAGLFTVAVMMLGRWLRREKLGLVATRRALP